MQNEFLSAYADSNAVLATDRGLSRKRHGGRKHQVSNGHVHSRQRSWELCPNRLAGRRRTFGLFTHPSHTNASAMLRYQVRAARSLRVYACLSDLHRRHISHPVSSQPTFSTTHASRTPFLITLARGYASSPGEAQTARFPSRYQRVLNANALQNTTLSSSAEDQAVT